MISFHVIFGGLIHNQTNTHEHQHCRPRMNCVTFKEALMIEHNQTLMARHWMSTKWCLCLSWLKWIQMTSLTKQLHIHRGTSHFNTPQHCHRKTRQWANVKIERHHEGAFSYQLCYQGHVNDMEYLPFGSQAADSLWPTLSTLDKL